MNEVDPKLRSNGNDLSGRDENNDVFHREIESHTVSLLRESALRCPEVVAALGKAAIWRQEVFHLADSLGELHSSFVGIFGRGEVSRLVPKIRQAFNATMEVIVSRVEPDDIVHDDPAAEIASIALNSRSKGADFLKAVEKVGHEFERDLADLK